MLKRRGGTMPEKRKKGKHLTWEERHEIQRGLREHRTFAEIAMIIWWTTSITQQGRALRAGRPFSWPCSILETIQWGSSGSVSSMQMTYVSSRNCWNRDSGRRIQKGYVKHISPKLLLHCQFRTHFSYAKNTAVSGPIIRQKQPELKEKQKKKGKTGS